MVPRISSLTLISKHNQTMALQDLPQALIPWQYSLKHLALVNCVMTTSTERGALVNVDSWIPNLPNLRHLEVTKSSLRFLDLGNCKNLRDLRLADNKLSRLEMAGIGQTLQWLYLGGCVGAQTLNLSGFSKLQTLHFTQNMQLASLVLTGCSALLEIECAHNVYLRSLELTDCSSLQHLTFKMNQNLETVDATHCGMLQTL